MAQTRQTAVLVERQLCVIFTGENGQDVVAGHGGNGEAGGRLTPGQGLNNWVDEELVTGAEASEL